MAGAAGGVWKRAAAWLAMAAAMAGPSGAVGQGTGPTTFGEARVQIPGQKRVTPLPNRMTGQSACPGYTVDNYMSQYNQRRATETSAAFCALAYSGYAVYLKAIATGEPQSKIDEAYAKHVRDSKRAVDFEAGTPKPAPEVVAGKAPTQPIPTGGVAAKCAAGAGPQTTNIEVTVKSPKTKESDALAVINKRVTELCGGHFPKAEIRYRCKAVSGLFGDYNCKVLYTCPETAPLCTPAPR